MAKSYAIGLISALAASASLSQSNTAFADGPLNFSPFSFPSSNSPQSSSGQSQSSTAPQASTAGAESAPPKVRNDNPRTSSAGFDPEPLERGAKMLKEISSSPNAKKVWNSRFLLMVLL